MPRQLPLVALAALLLAACVPVVGTQPELPTPAASTFPDVFGPTSAPAPQASRTPIAPAPVPSAMPSYDPFLAPGLVDVQAPSTFIATFGFTPSSLRAGDSPAVTTDVFQGGLELQVGEVDTLIEHASFNFSKLSPGLKIGDGHLDVGLPVRVTVPITLAVIETDGKSSALVSVKADSSLAHVYIADMQIRALYGSLAIVSLANAARASANQGEPLLPHAARSIQSFAPGFIQLSSQPGPIRTRVIVKSVPDPINQVVAQHVIDRTLTLTP